MQLMFKFFKKRSLDSVIKTQIEQAQKSLIDATVAEIYARNDRISYAQKLAYLQSLNSNHRFHLEDKPPVQFAPVEFPDGPDSGFDPISNPTICTPPEFSAKRTEDRRD